MTKFLVTITLLWFLGCDSPTNIVTAKDNLNETTIFSEDSLVASDSVIKIIAENPPPPGAVFGNYNGDAFPFYARVLKEDTKNHKTYIAFNTKNCPQIVIPETVGGSLSSICLEGFDRDLLLFTAKLKDTSFNKYFLYILRNQEWKQVVNPFAIHKSNLTENLQPLQINPDETSKVLRNYSVFDLDETSPHGYTWRLLTESVVIDNW
jgi:hypothetical protein